MPTRRYTPPMTMDQALKVFNLTEQFSGEDLSQSYENARLTWHPARFAGLTNNPGKYMEMYKKGEVKTKEIETAYQILREYLDTREAASTTKVIMKQPPPHPQ